MISDQFTAALRDVERRYGSGTIIRLGERPAHVDVISTGSLALDIALGVGGIPRGRVTEIYGPESSGKTTLCQHLIAEVQRQGGVAAYVDMEHALDRDYAARCGVDVDALYLSQPETGEQALEIAEAMIRGGADLVVVDSVAALVPRAEVESEMGDNHAGLQARLVSQAMRKLAGPVNRANAALVLTTQLRQKLGVMFGNPETAVGGYALRHHASIRLDLRRVESIKNGDVVVGNLHKATVKKSKVAAPFRVAEFRIMYDCGIIRAWDIFNMAAEGLLIARRGKQGYCFGDIALGNEASAIYQINSDPALALEIENQVRQRLGVPPMRGLVPATADTPALIMNLSHER